MKKSLIFLLLLLLPSVAYAQTTLTFGFPQNSLTANSGGAGTTGTAYALPGNPASVLTWTASYSVAPASVTLLIECSLDNTTYFTCDTSTSTTGEIRVFVTSARFVRAKISAIGSAVNTTVALITKAQPTSNASLFNGGVITGPLKIGDGTSSAPSYSFSSDTGTGFYRYAAGKVGLATGGSALTPVFCIGANTAAYPAFRRNSSRFEFVNCSEAAYIGISVNDIGFGTGGFFIGTASGVMKLQNFGLTTALTFQVNATPTCSSNCGTSPTITGTDNSGTITMGATGVPASGFVVTFGSTWPSAPACQAQSGLTSMVVGKMPIAVQSTTTTLTITTNGTAPSNSDKYTYTCFGGS
jgi:hypothetical protein